MTTIMPERVKDIRDSVENHIAEPNEDWLETINYPDLLAILDEHSALKAEVERIRGNLRLVEADRDVGYEKLSIWKGRAEKAEAELALGNKAWDIQRDKLEKAEAENEGWAAVLEDAANKHLRNLDRIARLQAENERLRADKESLRRLLRDALTSAQDKEAELAAAQMTNAKNGAVIIEQMVALEHQRPLVEAVMGVGINQLKAGVGLHTVGMCRPILAAALALREEKK